MPAPITSSETQVNTATTGDQWDPTVTLLSDGGWVVVWMGRVAIGSAPGIFGQRYNADGTPVGGEFQVNSASADQWEGGPSAAALPDGGWIVTWYATSPHGGASPQDAIVYMRRYDSTGAPAGEVQVNTPDGFTETLHPDVAVLADGGWVIVWHSRHSGTDANEDIYGQRYDSTGVAVGGEFQVNTGAARQLLPSVTELDDGGWIVTWMSDGQDGSGWGVYAQRYNADGSANGGETLITTVTAGNQLEPHLATLDDGGWVIVWHSSGQDGSGHGIFARRYDASGAAVGGEFQVNTTTANDQLYATVEALPDGGWAVTWLSIGPGFDGYGGRTGNVYLQRYDAAGNPVGTETFVGTASEGSFSNLDTRLAALADGSLVVTWGQYGTDGSGWGVYARTFDAPVNVINGTEGDDFIEGTPGDDLINALGGNDEVFARDGNDEVHAGDGDDFAQGNAGNDTLYGGDGNDVLQGDAGDFNIGQSGDDVVYGEGGNDTLRGGLGDDQLFGGDGNDHLRGNGGVDYFDGGSDTGDGPSTGYGDRISFYEPLATQGVVADLRTGIISNDGYGNVETMVGIESLGADTAYVDTFYGNDSRNFLWGGRGDFLFGFGGDDLLNLSLAGNVDGGTGTDVLRLQNIDNALIPDTDGDGIAEEAGPMPEGWFVNLLGGTMFDGFGNFGTVTGVENVDGSELADELRGDHNNNVLRGLGGDDFVIGNGGDDTVEGGDGNDLLRGDAQNYTGGPFGNDTLFGGAGDDHMRGGPGVDYFDGGTDSGGESIYGGIGDRISFFEMAATAGVVADLRTGVISNDGFGNVETMVGIESLGGDTAFVDTFYGNDNRNSLLGGRGDQLYGFGGDDNFSMAVAAATVDGGDGTDLLSVNSAGGWLLPDADSDGVAEIADAATAGWTVDLTAGSLTDGYGNSGTVTGIENVTGSELDDVLIGDGNDNVLNGNDGDDTLEGRGGNDTLDGGNGSDTVSYAGAGGPVDLNLGAGFADEYDASGTTILSSDTLANFENATGSAFDDALVGNSGDNVLLGLGGNDTIFGAQGNDTLDGGDGDDFISGGQGDDTLDGGSGNDNLNGQQGNDTIYGGDGHDALFGQGGDDTLYGGDGDDFIRGDVADGLTPGNDYIDAGAGFDRVTYYNTNNAVTVSLLLQGVAQDTGQGMDILLNTEAISGSVFSDTLIGDDNDNWFFIGGAGIDHHTVTSDTISGNGGNDLIVAGLGNHVVDGGTGTDTLGFTWVRTEIFGGVTIDLTLQGAAQDTGQGSMTISGFENLSGSMFDDSFVGDTGANLLAGGAGSDTLQGGSGDDVLLGDGEVNMAETNPAGAGAPTTFNARDYSAIDFYDSAGSIVYLFEGQDLYDSEGNLLPREDTVDEFGDPISRFTFDGVTYDFFVGGTTTSDGVVGDDVLEGGLGNDTLDGGGGSDTASYANATGPVDVDLGAGFADEYASDEVTILSSDTLANIENVVGSAFADAIVGNGAGNALDGGGGNDLILGMGGDDILNGGDGNDLLRGEGFNNYTGPSGNDTVSGGAGDDVMWTSAGVDSYDGGDGFDRVSFFSFAANQAAVASLITQTISNDGFGNAETMTSIEALGAGTAYADQLTGNDSDNFLLGDAGDTLIGNGGDDQFQLSGAPALTDGGAGIDTITRFTGDIFGSIRPDSNGDGLAELVFATQGVHVDLSLGMIVDDAFGNSGSLVGIENVGGSGLDDTLVGDAGDNTLNGFEGDDLIEGRGGNDTLDGGDGTDTASYANAAGPVDLNLGTGVADEYDSAGSTVLSSDTLLGIEHATGSAFDDALVGSNGDNVLEGRGGDDFLAGADGDDTLRGGDGDDLLRGDLGENYTGPSGNDLLYGEVGNDTLRGGLGDDQLYGGDGNDHLRGNEGVDYFDGGSDTGDAPNTVYGDRISFFEVRATQGVVADLRTGMISNDGFGNAETMVGIESLGGDTGYVDTFYGNDGRNALLGGRGDNLYGFGGDDLFFLSVAAQIDGGSGIDLLTLDTSGGWLMPDTNADGVAEMAAAATSGWFVNLTSGALTDGYGNSGTVTGVENVDASALADGIVGDGNANVLKGRDGDDFLFGSGGGDTLHGGHGNDVMSGGTGADRFVIEDVSGDDRITDFTDGVDVIRFDPLSGVDSFSDLTFTKVGKHTLVTWGTDDSLLLENVKAKDLTEADFLFGG